MDKSKNTNISSSAADPAVEHDIQPGSNEVQDHSNPEDYSDEYMYYDLYYYGVCMSCIHWDGYTCDEEQGNCNYKSF